MSWNDPGNNGSPGPAIETFAYVLPLNVPETDNANLADTLQGTWSDESAYPMGTVVAREQAAGVLQLPDYVNNQKFKGEFTDIGDVVYASQAAGMGYRNNINQDIGGETGASNAIPMWTAGPVRGKGSNMTGSMATIKRPVEGAYGEVKGSGPDYGRYLANAYYADAMTAYVQEYVNAGIMASI